MAFENSLPAVTPVWSEEIFYPGFELSSVINGALNFNNLRFLNYENANGGTASPIAIAGPAGSGGGAVLRYENFRGVPMATRISGNGATASRQVLMFPFWPNLGSIAQLGGLINRADQRCIWIRLTYASNNAFATDADGILLFCSDGNLGAVPWPTAAANGFSFFGINGGAGAAQYVAYDTGGVQLEAVPFVDNSPSWNTADFIIIGGAPGRAPTFELRINGASIVTRTFNTALLKGWINASDYRLGMVLSTLPAAAGAQLYIGSMHNRQGPWTPDGLQLNS